MLKRAFIISGFILLASLPAVAASSYSTIIEDLPLMPGMVEKTDDAVIFDKPGGRIVETDTDENNIVAFEFLGQLLLAISKWLRRAARTPH